MDARHRRHLVPLIAVALATLVAGAGAAPEPWARQALRACAGLARPAAPPAPPAAVAPIAATIGVRA